MAKKSNKKKRNISKVLVIFLFIISLAMTAGTFAYWATNVEGTQRDAVGTLSIGSASGVSTSFVLSDDTNSGGNLVPAGMNLSSEQNAVEEINLTYDIKWIENNIQTQLEGTVSKGRIDVKYQVYITKDGETLDFTDDSNIYDLIVVTPSEDNPTELTLDSEAKTFAFKITMNEPSNQEEYNMIVNSEIKVVITYEIVENYIETVVETEDEDANNQDDETNVDDEDNEDNEEDEEEESKYEEYYFSTGVLRYYYETGEWEYIPYEQ